MVVDAALTVMPIYLLGALWLTLSGVAPGLRQAVQVGVLPFVLPDLVKAILAFLVAMRVRAAADVSVRR